MLLILAGRQAGEGLGHHGASGGIPMYDRWKYWTKRQISVVSGVAASAEREKLEKLRMG